MKTALEQIVKFPRPEGRGFCLTAALRARGASRSKVSRENQELETGNNKWMTEQACHTDFLQDFWERAGRSNRFYFFCTFE
jgi:hypothetical protein